MFLQLAVASYIYINYALKKKRKERRWWQAQLYTSKEVYSDWSLLADLNFQSVSVLYENFTGKSPSEFEFLNHWIGEKNLEKGHSVQENHFCSRKPGTDATFLGKWWFVPAVSFQNFQGRNQLHRSGSVWSSFRKIERSHADKTNIIICGVWKKFKIRF